MNGKILIRGRWHHGHTFQAAAVDGGARLDSLSAGERKRAFRVHAGEYLQTEHSPVHLYPGIRLLRLWHLPGPVLRRERDGGADTGIEGVVRSLGVAYPRAETGGAADDPGDEREIA